MHSTMHYLNEQLARSTDTSGHSNRQSCQLSQLYRHLSGHETQTWHTVNGECCGSMLILHWVLLWNMLLIC